MARNPVRLILTSEEKSLIKGLTIHTDLNDQRITSIFSHLSRSINHREIGYFKDTTNHKYQDVTASPKHVIEKLLFDYNQLENCAKSIGILPKEPFHDKISQSSTAMQTAVSHFNNPQTQWKSEVFITNAIIAWTYLLHAFFHKNEADYHYLKNDGTIKLVDGRPKLWELSTCIGKVDDVSLHRLVKNNLKYLIQIRNSIEHGGVVNIDSFLAPKLQACALNFNHSICEWFGNKYSIASQLSFAISFSKFDKLQNADVPNIDHLPALIRTANREIESPMSDADYNDPRYSFRVHVISKTTNNRNKADVLATYSGIGSTLETAIKEVEKPKYLPSDIIRAVRARGHSVNMHNFVRFWKTLDPQRNAGNGFGICVSKQWYWYQTMLDAYIAHLERPNG